MGNGFIDVVVNGQVLFCQVFQCGVNVVLCIINNVVICQIIFYFGGNFGGDICFFIIVYQQFMCCGCVIFQYFGQFIIINFQFVGSFILGDVNFCYCFECRIIVVIGKLCLNFGLDSMNYIIV